MKIFLASLKSVLNLFEYLKEHRKKFLETNGRIEESVLSLTNKGDVKNMGKVLKSDIALEILLLADGSKNTSEISRELKKMVDIIQDFRLSLSKRKDLEDGE